MEQLCDSHALIATTDRHAYPLAPGAAPLSSGELEAEKDITRLLAAMDDSGIRKAVLIQRNRYYGYDNSYIRDSLSRAPDRLRAVCSVDGRTEECAEQARYWLDQPGVVGLRFMEPERDAPLDWFAGDHARAAWKVAADAGALIQIHFFPWARKRGIELLLPMLRDIPVRALIVDNLSGIDLSDGPVDHGMDESFRRLADHPAIRTRVTTLALHRCAAGGMDAAEAMREVARIIGAERILWGTDIIPPGLDYADAVHLGAAALSRLDEAARKVVLADNAANLFFAGS